MIKMGKKDISAVSEIEFESNEVCDEMTYSKI